ncbi:T9SS type A sorting domain-containing protein, partial [bacterium]|nr:T9SS type A sorting domain-containing protein [bacterium]
VNIKTLDYRDGYLLVGVGGNRNGPVKLTVFDVSDPAEFVPVAWYEIPVAANLQSARFEDNNRIVAVWGTGIGLFHWNPATGITEDKIINLPSDLELSVFPNPANPSASIQLTIPKAQYLSLTLYDLLGRQVETLHEGRVQAGITRFSIGDLKNLTSGMYYLKAEGENLSISRKITIVK